ncbi:hypothetical protein NLG97_g8508 [Lecanicillium saksenae]|uniref:Uncharacterized protein n=1 Tax=Lecanicillium saksenae TaxID=468837 RepID=A0ACC1QIP8_9HYPO|nr:hypothetical protein NLG97_g8508 [Lecanicillium saksenae]
MKLPELPEEILNLVVRFVCYATDWDQVGTGAYVVCSDDRKTLVKMSRTCRRLHRVTLPFIFQHIKVEYDLRSPSVRGFRALCGTNSVAHVRRLEVDLSRRQPTASLEHIIDMAGVLTCHISRLINLYALRFDFNATPRGSPHLADARAHFASPLVMALRYVDFDNLRELDIYLPTAYSFGQFYSKENTTSRTPIESVCRRLRHLGVGVRNFTSRVGPNHRRREILPEDTVHPHEDHIDNLSRLVEAAVNVESLAISGTNHLDFTGVSFPQRLTSLSLSKVMMSADDVYSIFQISSPWRIIHLHSVHLTAGMWKDPLHAFGRQCPTTLVDFIAEACGYSPTGSSSYLRGPAPPSLPIDIPISIESQSNTDTLSLYLLQKRVVANRETRKFSDNFRYQRAKGEHMHDVIARFEI